MARGRTVTEGLFESTVLSSVIRQWAMRTDYTSTLASSSGVARCLQTPALARVKHAWVDLIDVDSQKWIDYSASARFPMSKVYELEGRRLRKLERNLASSSERLLVVSEAERRLFDDFCPGAPIQAIGNGVDTEYFAPVNTEPKPRTCVFVGVLNYLPNSDAVKWFADSVWGRVREKFPDAQFRIVGKSPTREVEALAEIPGIEVIGPVPDVRPWLMNLPVWSSRYESLAECKTKCWKPWPADVRLFVLQNRLKGWLLNLVCSSCRPIRLTNGSTALAACLAIPVELKNSEWLPVPGFS